MKRALVLLPLLLGCGHKSDETAPAPPPAPAPAKPAPVAPADAAAPARAAGVIVWIHGTEPRAHRARLKRQRPKSTTREVDKDRRGFQFEGPTGSIGNC